MYVCMYICKFIIIHIHSSIHESLANEVREFLGVSDLEQITTLTASQTNTGKKDQ